MPHLRAHDGAIALRRTPALILGIALGAAAPAASAQSRSTWRVRLDGQITRPLSAPQRDEYGFGGGASATLEWSPVRAAGVFARGQFLALAPYSGSLPQGVVAPGVGTLGAVMLGVRVRPIPGLWGAAGDGPWIEAAGGAGVTGGNVRPAVDLRAGASFGFGAIAVGPFVSYQRVFALREDSVLPGDAELVSAGLEIAFGGSNTPRVAPTPEGEPDARTVSPLAHAHPAPTHRVCPAAEHMALGDRDHDGCPDPDRDADGIADALDRCPDAPEDADGFADADGCPDPDNDADSIADALDRCPDEAEVINGIDDNDGCPDVAPVHLEHGRIVTDETIQFGIDSVHILPASLPILRAVARTLLAHPEWRTVFIEGHADDTGPDQYNYDLSYQRARSVIDSLWQYGVPRRRLVAMGFGRSSPRVEGRDPAARARNRRVEFVTDGHRSVGRARITQGYIVIPREARATARMVTQ